MYYCLECTNKLLVLEPLLEEEVGTEMFTCGNCKKTIPCVTKMKGGSIGKLDSKAYDRFLKQCATEILSRWDAPEFQKEKDTFIKSFWKEREKNVFIID